MAAVLHQFRDELLVCSTNEELLQVCTLTCIVDKFDLINISLHCVLLKFLSAVLAESQWQDTTACCTVACSVNL